MKSLTFLVLFSLLPFAAYAQDTPAPAPKKLIASDFDSLQKAFDALPETGGVVVIPPGTYEISEPLVLSTAETRIEGSGASTHIKNVNTEGKSAIILQPSNRSEDPKARLWRVQFDNFRVSGNEQSGDGIHAEGIQEIFLNAMSVDHHGGHGISLIDCYEDPRVTNSILTYNKKAGLFIDAGHDIVVNANHFEENTDAVHCIDAFNLCMNGNNLDDHLRHGVVIENTYGSVVSGNMIEECNGTAIILDRDCYGITLSANVIAHDMGGGIDLKDAHGCAVSANTFVLLHKFGVRIGKQSGRITVSANNFSNSHIGEGKEKRPLKHEKVISIDIGYGIELNDTTHNTITGNTFSGLDGPAVKATGACDKIMISGNVVTDVNRRNEGVSEAFQQSQESTLTIGENLTD